MITTLKFCQDFPWRVLHVKPRCEKKLAAFCAAESFDYYLPLRKETKVYQRRKVITEKPLFPSYLFAAFNTAQRVELLKTNYIVKILEVQDQNRLLDELSHIQTALEADPELSPCPCLTRGVAVKIVSGPMMGLEGVVDKIKTRTRIVLNVFSIGQGAALEVDSAAIERI